LNNKLDDAARAGWLYFVAGNTQDDIARKMGVSRQTAQRLVSTALSEGLVKVTLEHPIARCMALARDLTASFDLQFCEVAPTDPEAANPGLGAGHAAARHMQRWLSSGKPIVLALGTGRTMRSAVERLPAMECPHHKLVSLVGNIAADGSASFYDVISQMAVRVKAPHFPMPLPVIARTAEECRTLSELATVKAIAGLAERADVAFVGIGHVGQGAPLHEDGFIDQRELKELMLAGAVGDIVGWVFDANGRLLQGLTNERVGSVPIDRLKDSPTIGIATGAKKVAAIRAALSGGLLNGLITDEATAQLLLKAASSARMPHANRS
jgi:DNA-binding transcriptional regulator LsrR (DeoR family)